MSGHDPVEPALVMINGRNPLRRRGGLHSYVQAHALAALAAGFDVHIFCAAARSRKLDSALGTIHEVATPVRPLAPYMAATHLPFIRRAIVAHVRKSTAGGPVVIHGFGPWALIGAAAARTLERAGVEAVPVASAYTTLAHETRGLLDGLRLEHGLFNGVRFWTRRLWVAAVADRAEGRGYRRSRLVMVNYESVRALLVKRFGAALAIRRIPYASVLAFREPLEPAPAPAVLARLEPVDAPLVLSVSRHDPRKGLDILLRALADVAAAGIPFRACLVGPGPTIASNRALLERLGLGRQVTITGEVVDVAPYYGHADVFVLPSFEEGSGSLSLLEALQHGLAVVASSCDGIPEDVAAAAGEAGPALLVAPGDQAALADALARVLADQRLRTAMASAARETFERRFSAATFVEALRRTYAELGAG